MIITTRTRLGASFLAVSLLVGGLSLFVGGQLIYRAVLREAQTRISLNLSAAREIYDDRERSMLLGLTLASGESALRSAVSALATGPLSARLRDVAGAIGLDFAGVVDSDGTRIAGTGSGPGAPANPISFLALKRRAPVSGTLVLRRDELLGEGAALAERARIPLLPTARAAPRTDTEETAGLALCAAVPLFFDEGPVRILYGGVLLSRNEDIVDRIRDTVFKQETYGGKLIGTATIFFNDLRIATNVHTPSGQRAVGTRAWEEVTRKVLDEGERWSDRAFVVGGGVFVGMGYWGAYLRGSKR